MDGWKESSACANWSMSTNKEDISNCTLQMALEAIDR